MGKYIFEPTLRHTIVWNSRPYADFLDRRASGAAHVEEWSRFVIMQYTDEFLIASVKSTSTFSRAAKALPSEARGS